MQMTPKAAKALPQSSTCTAPALLMKGNTSSPVAGGQAKQ